MQEHRYPYARAFKPGGWTHEESADIEDIGRLVRTHYDPAQGRFKSHWEVLHEREVAQDKANAEQANKPAFVLPKNIIDDWTGQRFLEPCYGHYPCPPKPEEKKSLL